MKNSIEKLDIISKIIIDETYPRSPRYTGWFSAFPTKFDKSDTIDFNFDFSKEKDVVALIFLATVWNIMSYKWENAIGLIGTLYRLDLLKIEDWKNPAFVEDLKKRKAQIENEMNKVDFHSDRNFRYYIKNDSKEYKDGVFGRLHKIAEEYTYLNDILKVDEIIQGRRPELDLQLFYQMDDNRLKFDAKGKGGKEIKKSILKVKIPLILRELKVADRIRIDDKYCCVPDSRVTKVMKRIGYPFNSGPGKKALVENSETISKFFREHYDLPLFDFAERCLPERCNVCSITQYCAKNGIETSHNNQSIISKF